MEEDAASLKQHASLTAADRACRRRVRLDG